MAQDLDLVIAALEASNTGLQDLLAIFSPPAHGEAQMAAYRRFGEHHGMRAYVLGLQERNRAALAILKGGKNEETVANDVVVSMP